MSALARLGRLLARGPSRPRLTPVEVLALTQQHDAVLLDVRTLEEWRSGHAPGAWHIPLDQLPDRFRELPADRTVVAICRSGSRSTRAAGLLRSAGRDATDVTGGMLAWQRAGLPVTPSRR